VAFCKSKILAVLGINALGIILNLLKLDRAYNAVIRGKRIEGIELNSKIKFIEFNELQTPQRKFVLIGLFVRRKI
jgi:hypothetical protein